MSQKNLFVLAVGSIAVSALVVGCSSDPSKVSGTFDEVAYVKSVEAVKAKTHQETKQVKKTKRVCSGSGTKRRCSDVFDGYKTETKTVTDKPGKPGKPAMYCVELDNVNDTPEDDDQWYLVSWSTYSKWENKAEGAAVTDMEYSRSLVSCKR
jgi:hypothetical protein